jgi:HEPN domain-containing protein
MTPHGDSVAFEAWRRKAEEDFAAAGLLVEHGGPPATVCFLCQQVAEKYFKAWLLFQQQRAPRIHHLDLLLEDCLHLDSGFEALLDDAVLLKRYYLTTRYPDDLPDDVSPEEASAAFQSASRIRSFICARLVSG